MGKPSVVLHVVQVSPKSIVVCNGVDRIPESELRWIGRSLQAFGVPIELERIGIEGGMVLAKLGHHLLVLRVLGGLVDPFFPGKPLLFVFLFLAFDDLQVLDVDRLLRLDAKVLDSVISVIGPSSSIQSTQMAGGVP